MSDWRSYDDVAEAYERVHAPRFATVARDVVAMASPPADGFVLDVGTGTGVAAEATADGASRLVVGVDPAVEMLRIGHRVRPRVRFAAAQAIDLPFRNETFEVVTASFVLSHFARVETALFDILRVLRRGGRLAVSAWADRPDALQETWSEIIESVVPREMIEPAWAAVAPGHDRFSRREAIETTLIDAGLHHVRSETKEYRFEYSLDDWLAGQEAWTTGRFVRGMLDPDEWEAFRVRARTVFHERFSDPLNDFKLAHLAVGTKT